MKLNEKQLQEISKKVTDLGKLFLPFSNMTTKVSPMGERHLVIKNERYIDNATGKIVDEKFIKNPDVTYESVTSVLPISTRKDELEQATITVVAWNDDVKREPLTIPFTQKEMNCLTSLLGCYKKTLVSALSLEKKKEKEMIR